MRRLERFVPGLVLALSVLAAACGGSETTAAPKSADDAKQFLTNVNGTMLRLGIEAAQAGWVAQNYITDDTEALDARATQQIIEAIARFAKEAAASTTSRCRPTAPPAGSAEALARDGDAVGSRRSRRAHAARVGPAQRLRPGQVVRGPVEAETA